MKVLITGSNGFVGKNLRAHLQERSDLEVMTFTRGDSLAELPALVASIDFIFHLAGVNRPDNIEDFERGNTHLTQCLCDAIAASGKSIPVLYTSSSQVELDNPYGNSKRGAELALEKLSSAYGSTVYVFRLPNVFGKWAKPNYNSVVATFCYNTVRHLPLQINDPCAEITLVYIDDVIEHFISVLDNPVAPGYILKDVQPRYTSTVGELANHLIAFRDSRDNLISEPVGTGFVRALYSTYISYLRPEDFSYELNKHGDERGVFVEMLKTKDSGQFSFFTAHPGITRGGHYHHSKTEKFLVIKGEACFRFRHMVSGEFYELFATGNKPTIVETVPGWTHDITNIGDDEMIVMLWANEIFDQERPDTYFWPVGVEA
ncbi:MAG: NAD-dependent epimerase/dehydratase family protein [Pseudomonadales bacterium]|nr:NAD-dependent epimerase/dehydratase family protein [Pseudomonadales bacterium]